MMCLHDNIENMVNKVINEIKDANSNALILKADKGLNKLIIVESRTKANEITKFLGSGWKIMPTNGYIKDIIQPKEVKPDDKDNYGRYGVRVNDNSFDEKLSYVSGGMKTLSAIRNEIKTGKYDTLICSGDPDRAGSGISAQVADALASDLKKNKMTVIRACWHEITRKAVIDGLSKAIPMKDDLNAVNADRSRAVFDRLFGYSVSPFLWRTVALGTSGGRAQSPALRLIVERERKRMSFISADYYGIDGVFQTGNEKYSASLVSVNAKKIATGSSFDSEGQVKEGYVVLNKQNADKCMHEMNKDSWHVNDITDKAYRRTAPAPYKTSTFQQEVGNRLGLGSKQVMQIAQKLFENGYITYLRTNSSDLSADGARIAHDLALKTYGANNVKTTPQYVEKPGAGSSLDGHECIRPATDDSTGSFLKPSVIKTRLDSLDRNAYKVYDMVYRRTLASQMNDAVGRTITVSLVNDKTNGVKHEYIMNSVGTILTDKGWTVAMHDDNDESMNNKVPNVKKDDAADLISLKASAHKTLPPARYTEPQLVAKLEELGIGRPATYAQIVSVNQERGYVNKKNKALYPTWRGMQVAQIIESKIHDFVDYKYTAGMESDLDLINQGKLSRTDFLSTQWKQIDSKVNGLVSNVNWDEINKLSTIRINDDYQVKCTKNGFFLEDLTSPADENGYHKSVKLEGDELYDGMNEERCKKLMSTVANKPVFTDKVIGMLTDGPYAGYKVSLKDGKYGMYAQAVKMNSKTGEPLKTAKPVNITLPKDFDVDNADITTVSMLFNEVKLPRRWPDGYFVGEGKKGGYVAYSKGKTRRAKATFVSLPDSYDPRTISHDDAVLLFKAGAPDVKNRTLK